MHPRLIIAALIMCLALIGASSFMHLGNTGAGGDAYGVIAAPPEAGDAVTARQAILPHGIAERVHRGVANVLQLLIIAVALTAFVKRRQADHPPLFAPMAALAISLMLAFLGAWFGSPLRYPWIVVTNLTGGFALLALFWWLTLDMFAVSEGEVRGGGIRVPAVAALLTLMLAILSGAWTDAYYAALACPGLPDCQGQWLPGLKLWPGLLMPGVLDVDAHGKVVIDQAVAADIHIAHRICALAALLAIIRAGVRAWRQGGRIRVAGAASMVFASFQFALGVGLVLSGMSMMAATAHSLVAALLVISLLALIHRRFLGCARLHQ